MLFRSNALAHGRLRSRANFEGQQDVWNEVAQKNEARKTKSNTEFLGSMSAPT